MGYPCYLLIYRLEFKPKLFIILLLAQANASKVPNLNFTKHKPKPFNQTDYTVQPQRPTTNSQGVIIGLKSLPLAHPVWEVQNTRVGRSFFCSGFCISMTSQLLHTYVSMSFKTPTSLSRCSIIGLSFTGRRRSDHHDCVDLLIVGYLTNEFQLGEFDTYFLHYPEVLEKYLEQIGTQAVIRSLLSKCTLNNIMYHENGFDFPR